MKRCISFVVVMVLLLCSVQICLAENGGFNTLNDIKMPLGVGDNITLGTWEQDNKTKNGGEPIEWTVLAVNGNRALLITVNGIDTICYDDSSDARKRSDLCWETSSLRKWLNEEFYSAAFNENEKAIIQYTSNYNGYSQKRTADYVFCLNEDEVNLYFPDGKAMACKPSAYAKKKIKKKNALDSKGYGIWWLRDMASTYRSGKNSNTIAYVNQREGIISNEGMLPLYNDGVLVRPAMWIILSSTEEEQANLAALAASSIPQESIVTYPSQPETNNHTPNTPKITSGNYSYILLENSTVKILRYTGKTKKLTIPDTLDGYPVTSIGAHAFSECPLTSVTIPESITSIGQHAFSCNHLETVEILSHNIIFESNPFTRDYREKPISFIVAKNNPTLKVEKGSLIDKTSNKLIYGGNEIPEGVQIIGSYAFHCSTNESITIPSSVTHIEENAFYFCTRLSEIKILSQDITFGYQAFCYTPKLSSFVVEPDNARLAVIDGVLFDKTSKTLLRFPNNYPNIEYEIPKGIRVIGDEAFANCSALTSITIPDSVTSIGDGAFHCCESLTSLTIPDSVTNIGDNAFNLCSSLTSITIPDSVTSIGDGTFADCSSLTSITIPDSVTSIGNNAFRECKSLTSITIPDSVTSIGDRAFYYCESLTSITIPDSVTSIGYNAFEDCTSLVQINNRLLCVINNVVFDKAKHVLLVYNNCNAAKYTIPQGTVGIADSAFSYCESLISITIPDSVTSIGDYAFDNCESLTSITIPDSVTSIGDNAFFCCESLISITIPDSVTSIGDNAFFNCESLTSITIPDSVTSIGNNAFEGCKSLTSITIPDSVTSIGYNAFPTAHDAMTITVTRDSYAAEWCRENGYSYAFTDANDWLLED